MNTKIIKFHADARAGIVSGVNILAEAESSFGYNVATGEYGDMIAMGVIDPVKVTRLGLQNAASIAGLLLTTDCAVAEEIVSREPEPADM